MKCEAKRSDGQPCNGKAIKGGTVCRVHGGSAPQVRRKAEERLRELADRALNVAGELLESRVPAAVRASVVRDLLTRAGIGRNEIITLDVVDTEGAKRRLAQRLSNLAAASRGGLDAPQNPNGEAERTKA